jgi:SHS2 domain-containing protein
MSNPVRTEAGHHVLTHAGDVTIEAWAPSRSGCLEELVRGVVETFADASNATATRELPFQVGAARDEEVVLSVLDDVYFLLDSDGLVVVDIALNEEDGKLNGTYFVAPVDAVVHSGSAPRGILRSDVKFALDGQTWRGRVIVDV